jgi:hypothetical protein
MMGASTFLKKTKLLKLSCPGRGLTTIKMVGTFEPTTSNFYTFPVQSSKFTTTVPLTRVPTRIQKILTSSASGSAKIPPHEARILSFDN